MGKSYSRSIENKGDAQVSVINTLENHSEAHDGHEVKLWTILALVIILLAFTVHREYAKIIKKRARIGIV